MSRTKRIATFVITVASALGAAWLIRRRREEIAGLHEWLEVLIRRHGEEKAEQIVVEVRQQYAALVAETPMPVNKALRWHLKEKILPGLALYRVLLKEHDGNHQAALADVDDAFRSRTAAKSRLLFAPMKVLPAQFRFFKLVFPQMMKKFPVEGWDFTYIENSEERIAFNATRCFYLNTLTTYGASELTASFCKTDDVMAELFPPSVRFIRSHTLGRGDEVCDFQYCHVKQPIVIPLSMSSIYLIPCLDGYLQVDAGYDHDYPTYCQILSRLNIKPDSIRYLFLTHHHDDHAGFLNELTRDTDVTILAHEQAAALLQGGKNDTTRGGGYINGFIKLVAGIKMRFDPRWTLTFPPFTLRESDILLAGDDDQVLRQLGINGKVLYTPGHCIDHIALVLDSGEALCGDAAASFLLWAGTHYCTVFMTDMVEAYHSWQKMLDAGAQVIYPAHGRPFPADKLRQKMGRIKTEDLAKFF